MPTPAWDFGLRIAQFMHNATKRAASPTRGFMSRSRKAARPEFTRPPIHRQTLARQFHGELRPHEVAAGFNWLKGAGFVRPVHGSKTRFFLTENGIEFLNNPPAKPDPKPYYEAFEARTEVENRGPKAADAPSNP